MKRITLTLILSLIVSVGMGQTKPVKIKKQKTHPFIDVGFVGSRYYYADSLYIKTKVDTINCIAYTVFNSGSLQYLPASIIMRKRDFTYHARYYPEAKRYFISLYDTPIRWYKSSGETFDYQNERFFKDTIEIHPIEILTTPLIH